MRIVLLGAPGSGKGTQAALLVEHLGIPHISTGQMLRSAAKTGSEIGLKAKALMDQGKLVPDDIMLVLLEERLSQGDARNGFILDGYPRNIAQAEALDPMLERLGQPVDEALHIDVDMEAVMTNRIAKRAAEEHRSDDNEATVRTRMQVYIEQTAPVVEYYAEKGVLSRVLGEGTIEEVHHRIKGVLQMSAALS